MKWFILLAFGILVCSSLCYGYGDSLIYLGTFPVVAWGDSKYSVPAGFDPYEFYPQTGDDSFSVPYTSQNTDFMFLVTWANGDSEPELLTDSPLHVQTWFLLGGTGPFPRTDPITPRTYDSFHVSISGITAVTFPSNCANYRICVAALSTDSEGVSLIGRSVNVYRFEIFTTSDLPQLDSDDDVPMLQLILAELQRQNEDLGEIPTDFITDTSLVVDTSYIDDSTVLPDIGVEGFDWNITELPEDGWSWTEYFSKFDIDDTDTPAFVLPFSALDERLEDASIDWTKVENFRSKFYPFMQWAIHLYVGGAAVTAVLASVRAT
jgi:hypothetical protein